MFSRHVVKAVAEPEAGEAEAELSLLTSDESEELLKIRHTTAHICAMATQKLFPDAKCTIGPWCATHPVDPPFATPKRPSTKTWPPPRRARPPVLRPPTSRPSPPRRIDRGFYYDFDFPEGFSGAFVPPPHSLRRPPAPARGGLEPAFRPPRTSDRAKTLHPPSRVFRLRSRRPVPSRPLADKDLKSIKKQMIKIINKDYPSAARNGTREEARAPHPRARRALQAEIFDAIKEEPITIYHIGDEWWDLCAGPHVESTKKIHPKAIDLESVAGAYWRGDETKPMLQRIYGTAWGSPEEMKAYNEFKAEAARRDHRKVGKELDLFSIQQEEVGGGLVFWHPKGARMRNMIENFWKDTHLDRGYELLYTPQVAVAGLWQTSGHADFYGENMFEPDRRRGRDVPAQADELPLPRGSSSRTSTSPTAT